MADNIKEAKQRLELGLNFLLNNESVVDFLKKNKEFQTIIKNEIFILKSWSDTKDKKVNEIITKYDSISPVKYDDKPTVSLNDDAEKIDYTNYLVVYVRNIFKFALKTIKEGDKTKVAKVEAKEVKNVGDNNNDANAAFAAGAAFGAGMGGMGGFDPNSPTITVPNPVLQQQAQANVQDKILRGEVYIYQSKPKSVPLFKLIYTLALCIFAAALIGSCVCLFMLNGKATTLSYTSSSETHTYTLGTIVNAIFCILFALLFVYMGFSDRIRSARIHAKTKTRPSDNEKYQVTGISVGFTILFAIFIIFMLLFPDWGVGRVIYQYNEIIPNNDWHTLWVVLVVFTSVSLGTLALTIISSIILLACRPKPNINLLNRLMEEELSKLMGGRVPPNMFGQNPFNNMEEVKVEEPKKDKKDKKDKAKEEDIKN